MQAVQTASSQSRSNLRASLIILDGIRCEYELSSLRPLSQSVDALLEDRTSVDIAVVGRFKAGKSSFLNQLIGRTVIPVDVLPTTAVVTEIRAGSRDRVIVQTADGHVEEFGLESLSAWVSEEGNSCNAKHAQVVRVELTGLGEFGDVGFVDTPGQGSIFVQASQARDSWLPRVGAAVVALTADPPFSEDDLHLLREVSQLTPEITIILTKIDLLQSEQARKVESFVRQQVREHLGADYPIFPYSTRPGYEALRHDVRLHLLRRVVASVDEKATEIAYFKLRRLAHETKAYLDLALATAEASEQARGVLLDLIENEERFMERWRRQTRVSATDLKKCAREAFADGFGSLRAQLLPAIEREFDSETSRWRYNLARTSEAYQDWAVTTFSRKLSVESSRGEEFLQPYLDEASAQFAQMVRAFQDRLGAAIEKALGVRFSGAIFEPARVFVQAPDIRIDRTFDTPLELIWFLVPMPLFRPLIMRRLRSHLGWEVEKNLARLSVQWTESASAAIDTLAKEAEEFVSRELQSVREMVSRADSTQTPKLKAARSQVEHTGLLKAPAKGN